MIFPNRSAAAHLGVPRMQKESSGAGAVVATVGCSVLGMMLAGQGGPARSVTCLMMWGVEVPTSSFFFGKTDVFRWWHRCNDTFV